MNVFYAKSVLFCDRIVAVLRVPSRRGKGVLSAVSPGRQDCGGAESPVAEGKGALAAVSRGATGLWRY